MIVAATAGLLAACFSTRPPAPPLLRGATASGGWWGACPPRNETDAKSMKIMEKLAVSPEFNSRMEIEFPPGSQEQALVETLIHQGFALQGQCATDPTIKIASFYAPGRGFLPYATIAQAYWKSDVDGRIEWTKGFLRYSGL